MRTIFTTRIEPPHQRKDYCTLAEVFMEVELNHNSMENRGVFTLEITGTDRVRKDHEHFPHMIVFYTNFEPQQPAWANPLTRWDTMTPDVYYWSVRANEKCVTEAMAVWSERGERGLHEWMEDRLFEVLGERTKQLVEEAAEVEVEA